MTYLLSKTKGWKYWRISPRKEETVREIWKLWGNGVVIVFNDCRAKLGPMDGSYKEIGSGLINTAMQ